MRSSLSVRSAGPPRPGLIAHRGQRRRNFAAQGGAVTQPGFDLQKMEPQKLAGADLQTPQIRDKRAFNEHSNAVRGDLAEPGRSAGLKVGADRDLGRGTSSMVQADQIKNGQSASFPDMFQGLGREGYRYLGRPSLVALRVSDGLSEPEALNVKPRRHVAPTRCRFPAPGPP